MTCRSFARRSVAEGILAAKTGLTSLCLSGNTIGASGAKALKEALRSSSHLAELDMSANSLGAEVSRKSTRQAAISQNNQNLTRPRASLVESIGVAGPRTATFSATQRHCPPRLAVSRTAQGATHLADALECALFLETLDLSQNNIGDAGAKALSTPMRTGWFKLR